MATQDEQNETPLYPHAEIEIDLTGPDGNAFYILGAASKALKAAGATKEQIAAYNDQATSGDYNNLLAATARWVTFTAY